MNRWPAVFLSLVLLASTQGALQTSARSAAVAKRQAPVTYSRDAEANELFLKAREFYSRSDPRTGGKLANAREAIKLYDQAAKKDPRFSLALVELSRAWLRLGYSDPDGLSNKEILPPARAALLKALALDHNLPDARLLLAALYYNVEYDWEKAEREYRLVLRLTPDSAAAHTGYAAFLGSMGRFDEALEAAKRAEELAPTLATDLTLARIYYSMRRYDEAAEYCRKSLKKEDNVLGHFFLGFIHVARRQHDEAVAEFKTAASFSKNAGALLGLAYGYAAGGRREEALEVIEGLKATHKRGLIVPYRLAAVYLALGDKDRAIEWLRKDYEERGNWMNQLRVDPVMDPLRSDPRFKELMRRMKFKG